MAISPGSSTARRLQRKREERASELQSRPQSKAIGAARATQKRAIAAATAEAERNRQFRRESFGRFQKTIAPLLAQFGTGGDGGGGNGVDDDAQQALTASIERRGEQAQSALSSAAAKRGIFRGGASLAASAKLRGETEAAIAGQRAQFAESKAERKARERIARKQALSQISSSFIQGAGSFL
jgi:hypothetical protein